MLNLERKRLGAVSGTALEGSVGFTGGGDWGQDGLGSNGEGEITALRGSLGLGREKTGAESQILRFWLHWKCH